MISRVQRVCRQFHDLIGTSTVIQQKLFLKLSGGERQTWIARSSLADGRFAWAVPPDLHFESDSESRRDVESRKDQIWVPARLNPMHVLPDKLCIESRLTVLAMFRLPILESRFNHTAGAAKRVWGTGGETVCLSFELRPEAAGSWRNTFLTDPPTRSAWVHLAVHAGNTTKKLGDKSFNVKRSDDENGLTLGAIIDAAFTDKGGGILRTGSRCETLQDVTLDDLIQKLGVTGRKPAKCDSYYTTICLEGIVIPSEEEWASVK